MEWDSETYLKMAEYYGPKTLVEPTIELGQELMRVLKPSIWSILPVATKHFPESVNACPHI